MVFPREDIEEVQQAPAIEVLLHQRDHIAVAFQQAHHIEARHLRHELHIMEVSQQADTMHVQQLADIREAVHQAETQAIIAVDDHSEAEVIVEAVIAAEEKANISIFPAS